MSAQQAQQSVIKLWKGRSQERFYDAIEWLYSWNVGNCLNGQG